MSRLWFISCDRCGKESQPHESKQECLSRARGQGWHLKQPQHDRMQDVCPECWGNSKRRPLRSHQVGVV